MDEWAEGQGSQELTDEMNIEHRLEIGQALLHHGLISEETDLSPVSVPGFCPWFLSPSWFLSLAHRCSNPRNHQSTTSPNPLEASPFVIPSRSANLHK